MTFQNEAATKPVPNGSSIFRLFSFSDKLMVDGAPVLFPKNNDGTVPTFYVGRLHQSNPAWMAATEREQAKYTGRIRAGKMDGKDWAKITKEVFINCILRKWENFYDEAGVTIPFNEENARKYMELLPELYDHLSSFAATDENYRKEALEQDAGN